MPKDLSFWTEGKTLNHHCATNGDDEFDDGKQNRRQKHCGVQLTLLLLKPVLFLPQHIHHIIETTTSEDLLSDAHQNMSQKSWLLRFLGFGPYFRPRNGTMEGIAVSAFVGVVSGYYIFSPLLEEMAVNRAEREKREALEQQQQQQQTRQG